MGGDPPPWPLLRAYISAAFSFGIRAEHDYTRRVTATALGIKTNPVGAIPRDTSASHPGQRFLGPAEFRTLWIWRGHDEKSRLAPALGLMLATGQRPEEILRITDAVFERATKMLSWENTKNGLPHSIPLPPHAFAIFDDLMPTNMGYSSQTGSTPANPRLTWDCASSSRGSEGSIQASHILSRRTSVAPGRHSRAMPVSPRRCATGSRITRRSLTSRAATMARRDGEVGGRSRPGARRRD
jgi:integrase